MSEIICFALQKGGSAKTSSCVNIACVLATKYNKKILICDMDSQGHVSLSFGINSENLQKTIFETITCEIDVEEAIIHTKYGVDILPSNDELANLDATLIMGVKEGDIENPYTILKEILNPVKEKYDYVFIDTPPSLSIITANALTASDSVIIPMQCEYYALHGVKRLLKTIESIRVRYNSNLKVRGILPTIYDKRTMLGSEVLQACRRQFANTDIKVFHNTIGRTVRISEAPALENPAPAVILYPQNDQVKSYFDATEEIFNERKEEKI